MSTKTNKYVIQAETKGFDKANKKTKTLGGSMGGLTKSVGGVALAYFSATGLIGAIKGSITAFGEQEKAEKKLETALGKTSTALLDHASALQQQTIYGDEAIIGVQASIGAFIKNEDHIKASTEATLDLASALGMDLKGAGDLIAKTLGSSTNALSRYGIEVKGAVGSSERLESLTENIAKVFGGQATAEAETFSGKMAQLTNVLGDTGEAFGRLLVPLVLPLAEGLKAIGLTGTKVIEAFEKLRDGEAKVQSQTLISIRTANDQADGLFELQQRFVVVKNAIKDLVPESKNYDDALKKSKLLGRQVYNQVLDLGTEYVNLKAKIKETRIQTKKGSVEWVNYQMALGKGKIVVSEFRREHESLDEKIKNYLNTLQPVPETTIRTLTATEKLGLKLKNMSFGTDIAKRSIDMLGSALADVVVEGKNLRDLDIGKIIAKMVISEGIASGIKAIGSKIFGGFGGGGEVSTAHTGGFIQGGENVPIVAQGGEFVLQRSAVESIGVERLQSMNEGNGGGLTLNISAPLIDSTIVDTIIPKIEQARREGLA